MRQLEWVASNIDAQSEVEQAAYEVNKRKVAELVGLRVGDPEARLLILRKLGLV
jgi:hypothetical protein